MTKVIRRNKKPRMLVLGGIMLLTGAAFMAFSLSQQKLPTDDNSKYTTVASTVTTLPHKEEKNPTPNTNRLVIPGVNVNAEVIRVGLTKSGSLDTPPTLEQVGWYTGSAPIGSTGVSIVDGHLGGTTGEMGVLQSLSTLKAGDSIQYFDADGKEFVYKVKSSQAYPNSQETAQQLFDTTTASHELRIITCHGKWSSVSQDFDKRWIVYATLATSV